MVNTSVCSGNRGVSHVGAAFLHDWPPENPGHQGMGEHPWLATLYTCHKSLLGELNVAPCNSTKNEHSKTGACFVLDFIS